MGARSRHECGEPREPVLGGEQQVRRAIAEGVCELEHDPTGGIEGESLERDGRASPWFVQEGRAIRSSLLRCCAVQATVALREKP